MIKSFINDVKRTLGEVLIKNDFKIVTTVSKNDYIMFAKRYSEELAVYVRCTDNRSHGHNVDVDYFFTPVNSPDDSIELFGIGIKINIISIYDVNDNIMYSAGYKIVALFNTMNALERFVLNELENPFIRSRRYEYYIKAKKIFNLLKFNEKYKEKFEALIIDINNDLKTNKKNNSSRILCTDFVQSLPTNFLGNELSELNDLKISSLLYEEIYNHFVLDK